MRLLFALLRGCGVTLLGVEGPTFIRTIKALLLGSTFGTSAIDIEGMVGDLEMAQGSCIVLNSLKARVAELDEAPTGSADHMVVLPTPESTFIVGDVASKLVFDQEAAIYEEFEGIVEGCTANATLLVLHEDIEGLHVEVPLMGIDLLEDGEALRGAPVGVLHEVGSKDVSYLIERGLINGFLHRVLG
jgi:hypothetical protein